jgi:hypothetical protein
MATVLIGPSKIRYLVHKALVAHHSEYFSKALNGPWTEMEERVVTLATVGEEECKFGLHYGRTTLTCVWSISSFIGSTLSRSQPSLVP